MRIKNILYEKNVYCVIIENGYRLFFAFRFRARRHIGIFLPLGVSVVARETELFWMKQRFLTN